MADEIENAVGFRPELIGGSAGIFDVHAEGELVFSKHSEGNRFPEHEEVLELLKRIQSR